MENVEAFLGLERIDKASKVIYRWSAKDRRGRIVIISFKAMGFCTILSILVYLGVGADGHNTNGKIFLILGGLLAIVNLTTDILALSKNVFFTLDVEQSSVSIRNRTYDVGNIANVRVQTFASGRFSLTYRIYLCFKNGHQTLVASRLSKDESDWLKQKLHADLNLVNNDRAARN